MAGNIKGITIEFSGDTTKLDRSLKEVDRSAKSIDRELKQVNNALKFNPTSIDLWRQKQDLLKQKISDTETRLKILKQQQAAMDAKGVDKNSEQYRKLQREIITTESKLKTFKSQLRAVGNINLRALGAQMKEVGSKITAAGQSMRAVSRYAAVVAGAIGVLTYKAGRWADQLNTMSKIYHINTRDLQLYAAAAKLVDVDVETIAKSHVKLAKNMGNAADGSKKQTEAFKKLGVQIADDNGQLRDADTVWQETIAALGQMENQTERDAIAMTLMGKSAADLNPLIEDGGETYKRVAETMQKYGLDFIDQKTLDDANEFNDKIDTIKAVGLLAFQALGAKIAGVLAPALERAVEAVGKFANWLSQLDPVILAVGAGVAGVVALMAPLLLIVGGLVSAGGALLGVLAGISAPVVAAVAAIGALVAILATAFAKSEPFRKAVIGLAQNLGQVFLPVIQQAVAFFKQLFTIIAQTATEVANDLAPVLVALTPVLTTIAKFLAGRLKTAFTVVITAVKLLSTVIKTLASIAGPAFTSIVTKATALYTKIKNVFSRVKSAMIKPFETAKSIIKGIIDKIKGFFNFKVPTPHIPLPHFKISPAGWDIGDLVKGKIPSLSVKWYAKGGIFDSPTIAGIGEAGPEAVIPLNTLWKKLDNIAAASAGNGVTLNIYAPPGMDINQLTEKVQRELVRLQRQRMKAWG